MDTGKRDKILFFLFFFDKKDCFYLLISNKICSFVQKLFV